MLEIRHLQMLLALEATSSVTEAAAQLNITPSALSHRMREAERRLGSPLFYREFNRVDLTPAGRRLLSSAKKVVAEISQAEREMVMMHGGYDAVVRIGSRANICNAWIARFWRHVSEAEPSLALEIVVDAAPAPLEFLRAGKIDLAIYTGESEKGGLTSVPLFEDELVGLVSPHDPSAAKPFLTGLDYMDRPMVAYGLDIEPAHEYELMFSKYDGLPRRLLNVGTADAILEFIRNDAGMGVLPRAAVNESMRGEEICLLPLTEQRLRVDWQCAVMRTTHANVPHMRVFRYIIDWCSQEFRFGQAAVTQSGSNVIDRSSMDRTRM